MNFTREPIIETVITPKEGCKLVVRNSKGAGQEDYFVDAIEVVSFGSSLFYRSIERPKSFLVPVSDYEVIELKETRLVLKNVSLEKSIKIGGGKEAPKKESKPEETELKKKDKKRPKRKKPMADKAEKAEPKGDARGGILNDETQGVSSSMVRKLIPPPTQLIKEKLAKSASDELVEKNLPKKEDKLINDDQKSSKKQNETFPSRAEKTPIKDVTPVKDEQRVHKEAEKPQEPKVNEVPKAQEEVVEKPPEKQ